MILLLSGLISAVVSALVALVVAEMAAQWVDALRARRRLRGDLLTLGVAAARIVERVPTSLDSDARTALREEQQRVIQLLRNRTGELLDGIGYVAGTYTSVGRDVILNLSIIMRLVVISPRTGAEKATIIRALVSKAAPVLGGSIWRPVRRARALFELADALQAYSDSPILPTGLSRRWERINARRRRGSTPSVVGEAN